MKVYQQKNGYLELDDGTIWMNTAQLSKWLGYPITSPGIRNIWARNKSEFEPHTKFVFVMTNQGSQNMRIFDSKACFMMAMHSLTKTGTQIRIEIFKNLKFDLKAYLNIDNQTSKIKTSFIKRLFYKSEVSHVSQ